jgi:glycosyltransferase involved in cell wall biosynthesis
LIGKEREVAISSISVLFVVNDAGFFVSHRLPIAQGILDSGGKVALFAANYTDETLVVLSNAGIEVYGSGSKRSKINLFVDLGSLHTLYRVIRQNRPDILHFVTIRSIVFGFLVFPMLFRRNSFRRLFAFSGLGYLFISGARHIRWMRGFLFGLLRILKSKRDWFLFQNVDDRQLVQAYGLAKAEQTRMIRGSGVNLQDFPFMPLPNDTPLTITMVSRLLVDKGVREFFGAASQIYRSHPDVRFWLVGELDDGNPKSMTRQELEKLLSQTPNLHWLGQRRDIAEIYKDTHIACLPSYREGLPKSLLEALAVGRPIIATDVPGCRETVKEGWNGHLVEAKSVRSLAEGLLRLIRNPSVLEEMGRRSRELAERDFSVDAVVDQTLSLYQEMLAG